MKISKLLQLNQLSYLQLIWNKHLNKGTTSHMVKNTFFEIGKLTSKSIKKFQRNLKEFPRFTLLANFGVKIEQLNKVANLLGSFIIKSQIGRSLYVYPSIEQLQFSSEYFYGH